MMVEYTKPVMSPVEIHKEYSSAVELRTEAWLSSIQTEIKRWWTNSTQDCVVVKTPAFMDPELKLNIIQKLQSRGWSVREGNNGKYLILYPENSKEGE